MAHSEGRQRQVLQCGLAKDDTWTVDTKTAQSLDWLARGQASRVARVECDVTSRMDSIWTQVLCVCLYGVYIE